MSMLPSLDHLDLPWISRPLPHELLRYVREYKSGLSWRLPWNTSPEVLQGPLDNQHSAVERSQNVHLHIEGFQHTQEALGTANLTDTHSNTDAGYIVAQQWSACSVQCIANHSPFISAWPSRVHSVAIVSGSVWSTSWESGYSLWGLFVGRQKGSVKRKGSANQIRLQEVVYTIWSRTMIKHPRVNHRSGMYMHYLSESHSSSIKGLTIKAIIIIVHELLVWQ